MNTRPKLVNGADLSAEQLRQVRAAFVYRWTAIGEGKPYATEQEWITRHAFYIRADGCIANRPGRCEPI